MGCLRACTMPCGTSLGSEGHITGPVPQLLVSGRYGEGGVGCHRRRRLVPGPRPCSLGIQMQNLYQYVLSGLPSLLLGHQNNQNVWSTQLWWVVS
jgi:hypothetical protein